MLKTNNNSNNNNNEYGQFSRSVNYTKILLFFKSLSTALIYTLHTAYYNFPNLLASPNCYLLAIPGLFIQRSAIISLN